MKIQPKTTALMCTAGVFFVINIIQYTYPIWMNIHPFDPEGNINHSLYNLHEFIPPRFDYGPNGPVPDYTYMLIPRLILLIGVLGVFAPTLVCIEAMLLRYPLSITKRFFLGLQTLCILGGTALYILGVSAFRMENWMDYTHLFTFIGRSIPVTLILAAIGTAWLCLRKRTKVSSE